MSQPDPRDRAFIAAMGRAATPEGVRLAEEIANAVIERIDAFEEYRPAATFDPARRRASQREAIAYLVAVRLRLKFDEGSS